MTKRDYLAEARRHREAERLVIVEFNLNPVDIALALLDARDRIDELERAASERREEGNG